jgi:hypothetical protein
MTETRKIFFDAVEAERKRQDQKWGGRDHDIQHNPNDWTAYIARQASRTSGCAISRHEFETQMVRVAALALAAFEAGRPPHA